MSPKEKDKCKLLCLAFIKIIFGINVGEKKNNGCSKLAMREMHVYANMLGTMINWDQELFETIYFKQE